MATDRSARFGGWSIDVQVKLGELGLHLEVETSSRTVAVVGPSGAGKSTLLRVLAGVERRARGRVSFDGRSWLDSKAGQRVEPWGRRVGWVPQDASLFPHLSVRENLAYAGLGLDRLAEVADLLEVTPLLERRPRRLSGGERQRVAVGRALLSDPALLLLDEPFSALDRPLRVKLARLLRGWAEARRLPLVLVSHDHQDTEILAAEQWRLSEGVLRLSEPAPTPSPDSQA
jgi:molybdate transport system ATP-binding protein